MQPEWILTTQRVLDTSLFTIGSASITFERIISAFLVLFIAFWITRISERVILRLSNSDKSVLSASGFYTLSRILLYTIWLFGVIFAVQALGIDLSSFALFGGALGIGVGLGLQSIFSNFVSGITLLVEKTLKVGDFVELESGIAGKVSEINVRFTRVTTNDFVDVIVPNSEFVNGKVRNWSFRDPHRRIHVPFSVAYGSDKNIVREAGLAAAAEVPGTVTETGREPDVWLVGFGDSALNFELIVWVGQKMASSPGRTQALYLWALDSALREHNLVVPFPQRDLHIRSGSL